MFLSRALSWVFASQKTVFSGGQRSQLQGRHCAWVAVAGADAFRRLNTHSYLKLGDGLVQKVCFSGLSVPVVVWVWFLPTRCSLQICHSFYFLSSISLSYNHHQYTFVREHEFNYFNSFLPLSPLQDELKITSSTLTYSPIYSPVHLYLAHSHLHPYLHVFMVKLCPLIIGNVHILLSLTESASEQKWSTVLKSQNVQV